MPREVQAAMMEAAGRFVDMEELQAAAGRRLAEATGAEAGIVTTGAAASLTLGAAACLAGLDPARMDSLPDTAGMPNEILIPRGHRNAYDHALRAAGARLVEVGVDDRFAGAGVRGPEPWEFGAAIGPKTAAVAYVARPGAQPPLHELTAVAHEHGIPVLVDAAGQLPPRENLRRFIEQGADLVAFSGGKAIRGPQSTGILAGRRDLVASALLQMLDHDISPHTWHPPDWMPPSVRLPRNGLGRGFKVGKEEIAGLMAALELFLNRDDAAEAARLTGISGQVLSLLKGAGLQAKLTALNKFGYPQVEVTVAGPEAAWSAVRTLRSHRNRVYVSESRAPEGLLIIDPAGLRPGEEELVAEALREVLAH